MKQLMYICCHFFQNSMRIRRSETRGPELELSSYCMSVYSTLYVSKDSSRIISNKNNIQVHKHCRQMPLTSQIKYFNDFETLKI